MGVPPAGSTSQYPTVATNPPGRIVNSDEGKKKLSDKELEKFLEALKGSIQTFTPDKNNLANTGNIGQPGPNLSRGNASQGAGQGAEGLVSKMKSPGLGEQLAQNVARELDGIAKNINAIITNPSTGPAGLVAPPQPPPGPSVSSNQ